MNRHYFRLIFSRCLNMLVPVAELLTSRAHRQTSAKPVSQAQTSDEISQGSTLLTHSAPLCLLALGILISASASANPLNPNVVHGNASFQQQGDLLNITNTAGAIIEWQQFSIAPHETTRFIQPDADSNVLNRITGQSPSEILGQLQSNGHVWLINPNGVLFGADSQVDVAGLLASTLDISNHDFINGIGHFEGAEGVGNIRHDGLIQTPTGGQVILIAPKVENHGVIISPEGQILLAAGHKVELADLSNPALRVEITAEGEALNIGQLIAESGQIGIHAGLVRQSGEVNASSAVMEGGRIFLRGQQETHVSGDAIITATGTQGGQVDILGNHVAVYDQATVNVSGTTDAGQIRVGGDYLGKNPEVMNAEVTFIGEQAQLLANAGETGDGGRIIVWSDDTTRVHGTIQARGGELGGDGGFIETSGKEHLSVTRPADASAAAGKAGLWLLDPNNLEISNTTGTNVTAGPDFTTTDDFASLSTFDIEAALNNGTNVTITTGTGGSNTQAGNISISDSITKTAGGDASLTLTAHNNIDAFADITSTAGALDINLIAGGMIDFDDAIFTSNGGNISLTAQGTDILLQGTSEMVSAGGAIELTANRDILANLLSSAGGNIDLNAKRNITLEDTVSAGTGNLIIHTEGENNLGDINITGDISGATILVHNESNNDNDFGEVNINGSLTASTAVALISEHTIIATDVSSPLLAAKAAGRIEITRVAGDMTVGVVDLPGGGSLAGIEAGGTALLRANTGDIILTGVIPLSATGSFTLMPSATGRVLIQDGAVVTVTIIDDAGADALTIGDPTSQQQLQVDGSLIMADGVLRTEGLVLVNGAITIEQNGYFEPQRGIELRDGSVLTLRNTLPAGSFELDMNSPQTLTLLTGSRLVLEADAAMRYDGINWQGGNIEGAGTATLRTAGAGFDFTGTGDRVLDAPNIVFNTGPVSLQGTLTLRDGELNTGSATDSLTIENGATLTLDGGTFDFGPLTIDQGGTVTLLSGRFFQIAPAPTGPTINGIFNMTPDGNLVLSFFQTATIGATGEFNIDGSDAVANLDTGNHVDIDAGGIMTISNTVLDLGGADLDISGTVRLLQGVELIDTEGGSNISINAVGVFETSAGGSGNTVRVISADIPVNNIDGTVRAGDGTLQINNGSGSGSFSAENGSTLQFATPYTLTNDSAFLATTGSTILVDGQLNLDTVLLTMDGDGNLVLNANINSTDLINPATLRLQGNGTLLGSNTIIADVEHNSGKINPGASPGTLTINGNYTMGTGGILEIEVYGINPGQYDELVVNGTADVTQGTLLITNDTSFTPSGTFTLTPVTATTLVGPFSNAPANNTLAGYQVTYPGNSMLLSFTTPPVTPPTAPPVTPTEPPVTPPQPIPEEPVPTPEEPAAPQEPIVTPEQQARLIEVILNTLVRNNIPLQQISGIEIEVRLPQTPEGLEPWNSQFEETDRPNVCRLMCY
ncbi:filamentous hemagglutinin N-terminal domain-containing protein [Nitrincola sp. MINF-07-Sa-05]|uniref:two-partner secretion domain-containing protein n=1 Tax=Nitrincola salilacus TaxID=3400273 RepID=UPI003917FF7D